MRAKKAFILAGFLLLPILAAAAPLVEMRQGMPDAGYVPPYSLAARATAARHVLHLAALPVLQTAASLTPDAPYAADGSHLSFWKPSFVIGTDAGGEAGINYWEMFQQGHMNVGFRTAGPMLLDCRLQSAGSITYRIYAGQGDKPMMQGQEPLHDGHFFLLVPPIKDAVSIELWPTPQTRPLGIFGCDLSRVLK